MITSTQNRNVFRFSPGDLIWDGIITILLFSYVYSLHFKFLPVSTNIVLGGVGIIWYFLKSIGLGKDYIRFFSTAHLHIIISVVCFILISIISHCYNNTIDYSLIKRLLFTCISFFGAYTICQIIQLHYKVISFQTIGRYLTFVALLQVVLTTLIFFSSNSVAIFNHFLSFSTLAEDKMSSTEGFRLLGFGISFFSAGYIHSFILIVIAAIIRYTSLNNKEELFFLLSFIIISAISMMMARTTLVGIIIGSILLFKPIIKRGKNNTIIIFAVLSIFSIYLISSLPQETLFVIQSVFDFGFELFINIFTDNTVSTNSTDIMYSMYILPDNIKTWIIGDGYFLDPYFYEYGYYYMGTDIGYLRLIFYSGMFGLFTYIIYEITIIKETYTRCGFGRGMFIAFFLLFLIILFKGFADLAQYIILFYFCQNTTMNNEKYHEQY